MRYLVVGEAHNDCNIFEFDSKNQAIRYADILYANMCRYDKLHYENLYVLRSVNPDPEAADHYDGDVVKEYLVGRRLKDVSK